MQVKSHLSDDFIKQNLPILSPYKHSIAKSSFTSAFSNNVLLLGSNKGFLKIFKKKIYLTIGKKSYQHFLISELRRIQVSYRFLGALVEVFLFDLLAFCGCLTSLDEFSTVGSGSALGT